MSTHLIHDSTWCVEIICCECDTIKAPFILFSQIKLDYPDEHLISINGHFGSIIEWGPLIVRSLVLESNRKRYGPFGIQQGTPFTFPVTGGKVVGFHGRSSFYIDSIGVYMKPLLQHNYGINEKSKGYDILVAIKEKMGNMLFENVDNKVGHILLIKSLYLRHNSIWMNRT